MATSFYEIVIGSVVVEAAMALLLTQIHPGPSLIAWYQQLGFSAVAMDIVSLAVGTWLGTLASSVAGPSLAAQLAGVVAVQIAHDVFFGTFLLPRLPTNVPVRLFRNYAEAKGARILVDDALLMMSAVLCTRALKPFEGSDAHAVVGATSLYIALLLLP